MWDNGIIMTIIVWDHGNNSKIIIIHLDIKNVWDNYGTMFRTWEHSTIPKKNPTHFYPTKIVPMIILRFYHLILPLPSLPSGKLT